MAIKIKFDSANNAEMPTFALSSRNGRKIGSIPVSDLSFDAKMKEASEIFFNVYKEENGIKFHLWNEIKNFKLLYCPDWDAFFEMSVELCEGDDIKKAVTAKSLGESELSKINIYEIEINTEPDIAREDYEPTVLYDPSNSKASLLNRITEKAPHYRIAHVDKSIASIQRIFSFDKISIYDALQEIADEINCHVKLTASLGEDGSIDRAISLYDLESYCLDCNHRSEFIGECPECGSKNVYHGFGDDTTILASSKNLANEITLSTDTDAYRNCFRLSSGDDLMTATIISCNPNGSAYIWHHTEESKDDMSSDLVEKIGEYDSLYSYYYNEHIVNIPDDVLTKYNSLIKKYSEFSDKLIALPSEVKGFPKLIETYYNSIDFELFLRSGLMPNVKMQATNANMEVEKITTDNVGFIAVSNSSIVSVSTASSAALAIVKTIIDPRYQVKVNSSSIKDMFWIGTFAIKNYSDEDDTAISNEICVPITDDYESFVEQKIQKALASSSTIIADLSDMFNLDDKAFSNELMKYSLNRLVSINDACQACLNVMIEQGIADKQSWDGLENNLYTKMYVPYYRKLELIQHEVKLRESEIEIICGNSDSENYSIGLEKILLVEKNRIQNELNYEKFFGEKLWKELSSFRRDDTYDNSNYISDGLTNADLIKNAMEFLDDANKEILKAATHKHSISTTLKNLLVLKEFRKIVDHFEIGNWIRVKVDDCIYRLRLVRYRIDFTDLNNIEVEFSDIESMNNSAVKAQKALSKIIDVSASYSSVMLQAKLGKEGNDKVNNIMSNGLSVASTRIKDSDKNENMSWDTNGVMMKRYDDIENEYDDCQLKMYNSSISLTDDNWQSVKTAVGGYYYTDPTTGKIKYVYGVNAEVLIGKLILGEQLGIYNDAGTLSFDDRGFIISNNINTFKVDPNSEKMLSISNNLEDVFYVDQQGRLHIAADGTRMDITSNESISYLYSEMDNVNDSIVKETERATGAEGNLLDLITKETERATGAEDYLSSVSSNLQLQINTKQEKVIVSNVVDKEASIAANGATGVVTSVSLSAGTWLILGGCTFAATSGTTGKYVNKVCLSTSSTFDNTYAGTTPCIGEMNSAANCFGLFTLSDTTTVNLLVYNGYTNAMSISDAKITALKIK